MSLTYDDIMVCKARQLGLSQTRTPNQERNSTMSLFEVAIIEAPTPNDEDSGKPERLVFGPKAVIANDKSGAIMAALACVDITWETSRATVLVRPFV